MKLRVLLLGGNGFIGSHLIDALLKASFDVIVLDITPEHFRNPNPNAQYYYGNWNDLELLKTAVKQSDIVIHLISSSVPASSNSQILNDTEINLTGTLQLVEVMQQYNKSNLIFFSSGGTVYGEPTQSPTPESHLLQPLSAYGLLKATIESYLLWYQRSANLKPIILRPANIYGIRQSFLSNQGVIAHFLFKTLQNEPVEIWGTGQEVRDFVNVSDIANLVVMLCQSPWKPGIWNVGSGKGISLLELIEIIKKIAAKNVSLSYIQSTSSGIREIVLDRMAIYRHYGWEPAISLEQGIAEQWKWLQQLHQEQPLLFA